MTLELNRKSKDFEFCTFYHLMQFSISNVWICSKKEKIVIFYTQKWLITFHRAFIQFLGYFFVSSHSNLCPIYHISFYSFVKIQLKIFSMTYLLGTQRKKAMEQLLTGKYKEKIDRLTLALIEHDQKRVDLMATVSILFIQFKFRENEFKIINERFKMIDAVRRAIQPLRRGQSYSFLPIGKRRIRNWKQKRKSWKFVGSLSTGLVQNKNVNIGLVFFTEDKEMYGRIQSNIQFRR